MGEEVRGSRSTNRQFQNSHGEVKYSIGNAVAKELIHMLHGHGQWWGKLPEGVGGTEWREQRGKNQDNCNSIINKI